MRKTKKKLKTVAIRLAKLGLDAEGALAAWGQKIDGRLGKRLGPYLRAGEIMPGVALLFELLRRWLAARREIMLTADQDHQAENDRLRATLQRRNLAADALYRRLVNLRAFLKGVFGADGTEAFGFVGRTPRPGEPEALLTRARETLDVLRLPGRTRPPTETPGFDPDFSAVIPALESEIDEVRRGPRASGSRPHPGRQERGHRRVRRDLPLGVADPGGALHPRRPA